MTNHQLKKVSKFLSYILRHKPEAIGISLDEHGWANIEDLISKSNELGEISSLNRAVLQKIVDSNDKKRFVISDNGQSIRANQGHSIDIDLQLKQETPPTLLYHGTATRFLESILEEGLNPQQRKHVHLSTNIDTATEVGQRYGKPVILKIQSLSMHDKGFEFYLSRNGVWLTKVVPPAFIELVKSQLT